MPDLTPVAPTRSQGLVDVLDRILDKGLVVAGDIKVNLANVELLTIQVRLIICSIDKAEQIGLNWWKNDSTLSGGDTQRLEEENRNLRDRLEHLEKRLERISAGEGSSAGSAAPENAPPA